MFAFRSCFLIAVVTVALLLVDQYECISLSTMKQESNVEKALSQHVNELLKTVDYEDVSSSVKLEFLEEYQQLLMDSKKPGANIDDLKEKLTQLFEITIKKASEKVSKRSSSSSDMDDFFEKYYADKELEMADKGHNEDEMHDTEDPHGDDSSKDEDELHDIDYELDGIFQKQDEETVAKFTDQQLDIIEDKLRRGLEKGITIILAKFYPEFEASKSRIASVSKGIAKAVVIILKAGYILSPEMVKNGINLVLKLFFPGASDEMKDKIVNETMSVALRVENGEDPDAPEATLTTGAIVGIAVGSVAAVGLVAGVIAIAVVKSR